MRLSVIIPTYNRGLKLSATLQALLASNTAGLNQVEVLVVDDGSLVPAAPVVDLQRTAFPFTLRCIRQGNGGPAKARNAGFRASHGDIVLFMDDDIIVPPQVLCQHIEAHRSCPGSVIIGSCQLLEPEPSSPLFRYIESLDGRPAIRASDEFRATGIVASGQLSVERKLFDPGAGVYCDGLATPGAEEYELSVQLQQRGVPILHAARILARHDHPIAIASLCRQQYKHAVACAEAAVKCPATLELLELSRIITANGTSGSLHTLRQKFRWAVKCIARTRPIYTCLLRLAQGVEILLPRDAILRPLYAAAISAHFCAGVKDGLKKYAGQRAEIVDRN